MRVRCLECKFFYPFSELHGYCEKTGKIIEDPNMSCFGFVHFKEVKNEHE